MKLLDTLHLNFCQSLALAVLVLLGLLGNIFNIPMFFGIYQIFGSIFVLLAIGIFGSFWGLLVAICVHSYLIVLWGHIYAPITFIIEAIVVAVLLHRRTENIFIADALFWFFIGIPMIWLLYFYFLDTPFLQTLLLSLKQPVNGLFNALVATLLLSFLPLHAWCGKKDDSQPEYKLISFHELVLILIIAFVFISSFLSALLNSRRVLNDNIENITVSLQTGADHMHRELVHWELEGLDILRKLGEDPSVQSIELVSPIAYSLISKHFLQVVYISEQGEIQFLFKTYQGKNSLDILKFVNYAKAGCQYFSVPADKNVYLQGFHQAGLGCLVGIGSLERLQYFLSKHEFENIFNYYLINQSGYLLASSNGKLNPGDLYQRQDKFEYLPIFDGTYHLLPKVGEFATLVLRWKNSFYVKETPVGLNNQWLLITELPFSPYVDKLQSYYIHLFSIMLGVMFLALLISKLIQRMLLRSFAGLNLVTEDLPQRLVDGSPVQWPHTQVRELNQALRNIRNMANMLRNLIKDGEYRYQTLFSETNDAVFVTDLHGRRIMDANVQATLLTLYSREEICQQRLINLFPQEEQDKALNIYRRLLTEPRLPPQTYFILDRNGYSVPVEITSLRLHLRGEEKILVIAKDIKDRFQAEENLRLIAKVFDNTSEGILITDTHARIIKVNKAFCRITGYNETEVLGKNPKLLHSSWQDENFYKEMWASIKSKGEWQGELWNRRKDGTAYAEWLSISVLYSQQGEVTNYIGIFIDITEQRRTQERIHHLAFYDVLTELPNRTLFMDRLEHALERARREQRKLALLFLDLDNFKTINDTLGHYMGDQLLRHFAERVQAAIRASDTFARLGGDEFTLILEELEYPKQVSKIACKLLELVRQPFVIDGYDLFIGMSIGIGMFPDDANNLHDLMRHADAAMYQAKADGKNGFEFYVEDMNQQMQARLQLDASLRKALQEGALEVYFQPQVCVAEPRIVGIEALLRWQHPELGFVEPKLLIELAEENGFILSLGNWIFETCCQHMRHCIEAGLGNVRMAVNVSASQLHQASFTEFLQSMLDKYQLSADMFELELTEGVLMKMPDTHKHLNVLKEKGFELAIDDFGTGYSSLGYLQRFAINRLKIAQSFVQGVPEDKRSCEIVLAMIAMAKVLLIEVIAEGVETTEQLQFLADNQCELYQGYYYSPAIPIDELIALWQAQDNKKANQPGNRLA